MDLIGVEAKIDAQGLGEDTATAVSPEETTGRRSSAACDQPAEYSTLTGPVAIWVNAANYSIFNFVTAKAPATLLNMLSITMRLKHILVFHTVIVSVCSFGLSH